MTTLNEARYGSGKEVVKKTWAERLAETPEVESDVDEQLLMNVPYVFPLLLLSISSLLVCFWWVTAGGWEWLGDGRWMGYGNWLG